MALVVNLQRKIKLDTRTFVAFSKELSTLVEEFRDCDFSVAFVSDKRMIELNRFFRGKDSTTDVLSFPYEPDEFESKSHASARGEEEPNTPEGVAIIFRGDIVISTEQAARQARENKLTLEGEIKQLILHGLLHLSEYDHETDNGEMNARELELREKLGL